jgi:antitoxin (DNA-binding transcriptional repressor) of toxin-antitoxin stability system
MGAYSVAEVKAHLSAILEEVAAGREVVITRRGKPVARISREREASRQIDWAKIDAFRASLRKAKPSVVKMRKAERY